MKHGKRRSAADTLTQRRKRQQARAAPERDEEHSIQAEAIRSSLISFGLGKLTLMDSNGGSQKLPAADVRAPERGAYDLPHTERASHYFYARLSQQFDAEIPYDPTHAVEPLERVASWTTGDAPETFPTSL